MHYASSLTAGGTLTAMRQVMDGGVTHAFNPAGGLHHAHRSRASGFCIYNDAAVAIAAAIEEYGARVLYLDFDAHHGDGVQFLFYRDPRVLTVSMHEDGRFLFPGTGAVEERGDGTGVGFAVNMPFAPFTGDASWHVALDEVIPSLARTFLPDVILSNHGCDTHALDSLNHLSLSTASFQKQAALTHALAEELCDGRWIAVGSGGYAWREIVPRAWTILWCEMSQRALPTEMPVRWLQDWSPQGDFQKRDLFMDSTEDIPREDPEVFTANLRMLKEVSSGEYPHLNARR
jgi:acetoin utilization protein AcuC